MNSRVIAFLTAVCATALICAAQASADPAPGPPDHHGPHPQAGACDGDARELMQAVMAAHLAKELGLNDEQTVLLVRRSSEFHEQMAALRKERQGLVNVLKACIDAKKPDPEIEAKLNDLITQDAKIEALKKSAFDKAATGLTPTQRAKLYVALGDLRARMHRQIEKMHERGAEHPGWSNERFGGEGPPPWRPRGGPGWDGPRKHGGWAERGPMPEPEMH